MIDVLFVDDDASVLEGLENRLRPWRKQWSMRFARSGEIALGLLAQRGADVVVSDMRMPGMDGAALLGEVRRRQPEAVRIMLSGQTDRDGLLRTLPVAHQFLSKPCEGERLHAVIERACALRARIAGPAVKAAVTSMGSLPVLPRLYWDLVAEIDRADASPACIAAIIQQDVAMTARLLQVVNSAFFGFARPIHGAREAVTLLGIEPVRALLLSVELFRGMSRLAQPAGLDLQRMQQHALEVSALTDSLMTDPALRATAVAAGMLHDIGEMVLHLASPAEQQAAIHAAVQRGATPLQAERAVFACTHAEVGAYLLSIWGLPQPLVEAVAFHHAPAQLDPQHFGIAGALHVAEWRAGHAAGEMPDDDALDRDYLARVGRLWLLCDGEARPGGAP